MSVLVNNQPVDVALKLQTSEQIEKIEDTFKTNEISHQTSPVHSPLFSCWRPTFHLLAPHGWLNDPCGPGYDPATGKYHLAFQWNPKGNDWGDISWGHATSCDMVSWETSPTPCLTPSAWYDCLGIFTGCFQPSNINGEKDGTLTYIYTSVKNLPIHYTLPYVDGSESLSIAVSRDGGNTWKRKPCNPVLPGPAQGNKVTGWRDPFLVTSWPNAPTHLRQSHPEDDVLYGLISGGIVNQTPTAFVYAVKKNDLTDWKYVGMLAEPGLNLRPSRWSGDFGQNWEVANLVTLTDDEGTSRDFVVMGTEGCLHVKDYGLCNSHKSVARDHRTQRSQLWMCLQPNESTTSASSALMQYSFAGIFDNGLYYAANSFWDPVSQQQIVFGWVTEEDLPDSLRHQQGWSGLISLPRVLKLKTLHRVKRARTTENLRKITSLEVAPDAHGTYTIRTLGIGPDKRLEKLRDKAIKSVLSDRPLGPLVTPDRTSETRNFLPLNSHRWEVDVEIAVGSSCGPVGMVISDPGNSDKIVLFWDPVCENFIIERPNISAKDVSNDKDANIRLDQGREFSPHTLFMQMRESQQNQNENTTGSAVGNFEEVEETLHIRAIFDVSVLEIFVNERTALSTRIYHAYKPGQQQPNADSAGLGLHFFADYLSKEDLCGDAPARLVCATVWDGLSM